jgi:hypothetical protein
MDFDSCETLDTIVTNRIDLTQCGIGSFKGLKAGPTQLFISDSTVKSLTGLPTTLYELTTNTSTKLEMTVSEFINAMKPVNISNLYLGGYETAYQMDRSARNGHALAKDIQRLMKEKDPNWDVDNLTVSNRLYRQVLLDILLQLPTLQELNGYTKSQVQQLNIDGI